MNHGTRVPSPSHSRSSRRLIRAPTTARSWVSQSVWVRLRPAHLGQRGARVGRRRYPCAALMRRAFPGTSAQTPSQRRGGAGGALRALAACHAPGLGACTLHPDADRLGRVAEHRGDRALGVAVRAEHQEPTFALGERGEHLAGEQASRCRGLHGERARPFPALVRLSRPFCPLGLPRGAPADDPREPGGEMPHRRRPVVRVLLCRSVSLIR